MAKIYPEPYKRKSGYYYFKEPGSRREHSTGTKTKERAYFVIKKFIDGRNLVVSPTFREYAEPFFVWPTCPHASRLLEENKQIGEGYVKQGRSLLEKHIFTDEVFCSLRIADIRRGHVLDLRDRLKAKIGVCTTLNRTIEKAKVVLSEAFYRGDIDMNPGAGIGVIKIEANVRDVFSLEEIREMFRERPGYWPEPLAYDFLKVMAFTGMRNGEVSAITYEQISGADLIINRAFKSRGEEGRPKWDKDRAIVIPSSIAGILKGPGKGLVFKHKDGRRIGQHYIETEIKAALQAAKITRPGLTAYSFRHSLNSHLLAAGADPILLQSWMGWSSTLPFTRVQAGYTHLKVFDLGKIARLIDSLYAPKAGVKTG